MSLIEIDHLSHRFANGHLALDRVTLRVEEGCFAVIVGPNGSGKTTLLRHLNGLLFPSSGEVRVAGISVPDNPDQARQVVGMVFQNADGQIVGETVIDDVAFGPENLGLSRMEINRMVRQALEEVDLVELADQSPYALSGGEKRRLAIAGVMVMKPRVVVFDEPFSNLDYPGIRQVLAQIVRLHRNGHTILVTTHDLEKVIAHADRLIMMAGGQVVRDGVPHEVVGDSELFGIRKPCAFRMGLEVESWLT